MRSLAVLLIALVYALTSLLGDFANLRSVREANVGDCSFVLESSVKISLES